MENQVTEIMTKLRRIEISEKVTSFYTKDNILIAELDDNTEFFVCYIESDDEAEELVWALTDEL